MNPSETMPKKKDADYVFYELTRTLCPECRKVVDGHVFPEPVTDPVARLNIDSISLMTSRLQNLIPLATQWRSPMLTVQPLKGFSDRFDFAQF